MKIAIIGTGISGLGAAYLLQGRHDITLYEPNSYIGGHSRTIEVANGRSTVPVDTGFIVFNHRNYPHLTGLFRHLGVETVPSNMSFGASVANGWLEYGSMGMFAQKENFLRPQFWGMLRDILRFNRNALSFIAGKPEMTLRECMDRMKMGDWFRRYYLQAMGAAIWSCSVETILDYPAATFLRFFENHGLLTVGQQPQWHTVKGGSREYIAKITAGFRDKIRLSCAATVVSRTGEGAIVTDSQGGKEYFDQVIFACHADMALRLLDQADEAEREILGAFAYQKNTVVVHNDESFMPRHRKCWSSWVYLTEGARDDSPVVSLSYWMNNLQGLKTDRPLIVTLNPGRLPAQDLILDTHEFDHPVFTIAAINAQRRIPEIQDRGGIWHCGAYQRYGFHEDGLMSAVAVAEKLGATVPWL
ncbi:MAG: flavin-containing amine oxidase [Micavibrio sp.]|nr:flavin-containing amine oxidase [Micavibrio sp.]